MARAAEVDAQLQALTLDQVNAALRRYIDPARFAIGVAGALVVGKVMQIEVAFSASVMLIAFAASAATGIFFGFWPARRAASLRPVEALRYE